MNIFDAT